MLWGLGNCLYSPLREIINLYGIIRNMITYNFTEKKSA